VTVGRVLRALVTMRGLVIEWVTVKAFHEDFSSETGKVDQRCLLCLLFGDFFTPVGYAHVHMVYQIWYFDTF